MMAGQQRAQYHDASFGAEHLGRGRSEDEASQSIKGENLQAGVAIEFRISQKVALQLVGRLAWREEQQGQAFGRTLERSPRIGQTSVCLSGAGRADEKSRAHITRLPGTPTGQKNKASLSSE